MDTCKSCNSGSKGLGFPLRSSAFSNCIHHRGLYARLQRPPLALIRRVRGCLCDRFHARKTQKKSGLAAALRFIL